MFIKIFRKSPVALAVSAALLQASGALAYDSPIHVFSIDDVMGGFDGSTFGTGGAQQDESIICDLGTEPCTTVLPYTDKAGVKLYPVDSEFGYYIVDFVGAEQKIRDGKYEEGFVGNIVQGDTQVGIKISNAPTLKYKVKPPLGTWCQGLGGTSVKCETEHYTVMEHVLSCYETIPYKFADPVSGEQAILSTESGSLSFNCMNAPLDDNAMILVNGLPDERLTNPTPCESADDPEGCQMFPNDKTDMLNNIALSTDYSVQLKDDGKPLYGWGGLHKRPNDIRLYARLELPEEWKAEGAYFNVTRAELRVNHWVTNNPNDQLRPEDLENEAATGRKPSYTIEGEIGAASEVWKSTRDCYEGDGDFIEGETPASPIGAGTVLRNMPFALDKAAEPDSDPEDPPYAFSSDLYGAFTNGYYTTINRDPFEWSYDPDPDPRIQNFVGSPVPNDALGELVSGPRWRLKPNKFGQDLPGLEIPLIECSEPPFAKENIKYVVGTETTTIINLLDWDEEANGPSPLATSKGWVDVTANEFVTIAGEANGIPYTTNGLPMTSDFDLAVYVKGDSKSTAVYNAQLVIEYEGGTEPPGPASYDLALSSMVAPDRVTLGEESSVVVTVDNLGPNDVEDGEDAQVVLTGATNRGQTLEYGPMPIAPLASGAGTTVEFPFTADFTKPTRIDWTATVTATGDGNPINDSATARTKVKR